jgi:sugar-specific transcriptional regulator TrmB
LGWEGGGMSQEKVLKTLESLGFSQPDAQVYVFLGRRDPQKARDLVKALKIPKQQLYIILRKLQSKGIVNATLERPARFSAVPFEKVLDLFVKAKMEEAQRIQQGKAEILSDWQSIAVEGTVDRPAKFTVLEGRNYIYSKLKQMIEETKKQLSIISTVSGLVRADQAGLLDAAFSHASKQKIQFRILTELSEQNVSALKGLLVKARRTGFGFEGRVPELGLKLFTRIVIRDDEEAVFFITPDEDRTSGEKVDVCLWTDCHALVRGFSALFYELWRNATDLQKKIPEVETGKPSPKMSVISDAETAHKSYHEALRSAEKEVVMMTSSKGIIACWKGKSLVKEWTQKGVSVKIMAPITSENLNVAQQLLKCCEVRHVPVGYLGTTIVDGKHLFQFKNPPPEGEELRALSYFENTFYTDDSEYVAKTQNMLNDIWRNASAPSAITVESVTRPSASVTSSDSEGAWHRIVRKISVPVRLDEQRPSLTEKDILNKILTAERVPVRDFSKEIVRDYCTAAQGIIHPPTHLNLPDILFHIMHFSKNSSFGAEDFMNIMLWLETPKGYAYVPVALVGDNPDSLNFRKIYVLGAPGEQNIQLIKKEELQIQVHGNNFFAGWTTPIRLMPTLSLPPACILLEGYGNVKTSTPTVLMPSGHKSRQAANGLEAFVTFLHPSSKYSGPGTDGFLARELIMETYPP